MKNVICVGILLCSLSTFAQDDSAKIVEQFFKIYKEKDSDSALDYLFGTNKWMNDSKDQIENVKFKINSTVVKAMGKYFGYDLITKKTVGDKLVFYSYLLKYDRQPIRFDFLFYNPDGTWRLQNFSFDDSIKDELEEAAKAYRLKENLDY